MSRILVVEDSLTQAMELAWILEEADFEVETAHEAESAFELVVRDVFDLVVTDLHLPGESGFDLCRRIKSDPRCAGTLVLILTAQDDPHNVFRGLAAGADDFMTKGREPDDIVRRVRKAIHGDSISARREAAEPIAIEFLSERFQITSNRKQVLEFLVSAFEDVSHLTHELKSRSRDLSRANERLEREVRERERAEAKATEASEAKSQFLANMSHELRTPLNAIIGYTELIREDAKAEGRQELAGDTGRILTASRHLLALVRDILDISKIEAGRIDVFPERADVQSVVREIAATMPPLMDKNRNRFEVDCPPLGDIVTDLTKLRQALLNLLSNAAKFTRDGSIKLEVRRREDATGAWFHFSVTDTGIGIAPDRLEDLFEPFTQADSTTTKKYGGTGLGLSISRSFCRLLRGDLVARSELGRGSTFTIKLPVRLPSTQQDGGSR